MVTKDFDLSCISCNIIFNISENCTFPMNECGEVKCPHCYILYKLYNIYEFKNLRVNIKGYRIELYDKEVLTRKYLKW